MAEHTHDYCGTYDGPDIAYCYSGHHVRLSTDEVVSNHNPTGEYMTNQEWEENRNKVTQRFLGISAEEFIERWNAGEYPDPDPDLMDLLAWFPELD